MSNMFSFCSSLPEINLSNFKTLKIKNLSGAFFFCSKLKKLFIPNFQFNDEMDIYSMLAGTDKNIKIICKQKIPQEAFEM